MGIVDINKICFSDVYYSPLKCSDGNNLKIGEMLKETLKKYYNDDKWSDIFNDDHDFQFVLYYRKTNSLRKILPLLLLDCEDYF